MSRNCFGISSRVFALFDRFWFIILARNIECQSILQKTIKQFGVVASKYERKSRYNSNFQCVSLHSRICLSCYVARYVSPKCVSVWLLPSKPCLFPLKSSLEFVLHRGKPKFISFSVKFPANRANFQFYTTALYYGPRTVLPCLCFFFLNPAAEIMIHMLFNTLLKITPHNRQKRRKR